MMKQILAGLMMLTFAACSSTTTIRSSDPSTKIYVDGEMRGTGMVSITDSKIVGSTTSYRLERPGCQPQFGQFSRNEQMSVGALLGGLVLVVPFLWIMEYKPEHYVEFSCTK